MRRWSVFCILATLIGCSGEDDAGTRRDMSVETERDMEQVQIDAAPDLPIATRESCGGDATGPYLESHLEHYCLDSTGRVLSRLNFFLCSGCESPLVCSNCPETPTHYTQVSLLDWDLDMSGQTFESDIYFGVQCRIGGGCDEIPTWSVTLDTHKPGLCASGTYRFEYVGGYVEEGQFDAGAFGPPDAALIESCGQ